MSLERGALYRYEWRGVHEPSDSSGDWSDPYDVSTLATTPLPFLLDWSDVAEGVLPVDPPWWSEPGVSIIEGTADSRLRIQTTGTSLWRAAKILYRDAIFENGQVSIRFQTDNEFLWIGVSARAQTLTGGSSAIRPDQGYSGVFFQSTGTSARIGVEKSPGGEGLPTAPVEMFPDEIYKLILHFSGNQFYTSLIREATNEVWISPTVEDDDWSEPGHISIGVTRSNYGNADVLIHELTVEEFSESTIGQTVETDTSAVVLATPATSVKATPAKPVTISHQVNDFPLHVLFENYQAGDTTHHKVLRRKVG